MNAAELARQFSAILHQWLTPEDFKQINSQRPQGFNGEGMSLRIAGGVCGNELWSTQDLLSAPRICGAGDGIPHRVDRLRVIGNAVDVRVGMVIGLAMMRAIQ